MNTPISFELAKLLKEKGFDEDCYRTYSNGKISPFPLLENMGGEPILNPLDYKWKNSLIHHSVISAPTMAEVVMWLYEKHKIWINVGGDCNYKFKFEIHTWKWYEAEKTYRLGHIVLGVSFWDTSSKAFNSPTEAYEAAIEYTLNNLI